MAKAKSGRRAVSLNAFFLSFGSMLLLSAIVAAWLFRSSNAPFAAKLIIPAALVAIACVTPKQVKALLGYPLETQFSALPKRAELVAFLERDNKRVDLWLLQGDGSLRAYDTALDDGMKEVLKAALERKARGQRVMLEKAPAAKPGQPRKPSYADIKSGKPAYEIDDSAFALPPKDGQQ